MESWPEDEPSNDLAGLTKAQITEAEDAVRREMARGASEGRRRGRRRRRRRPPATKRRPQAPRRSPRARRPPRPAPRPSTRARRARSRTSSRAEAPALDARLLRGEALRGVGLAGRGLRRKRLARAPRKVWCTCSARTVDASHYMTDGVDYLIVGANASGTKIQKGGL